MRFPPSLVRLTLLVCASGLSCDGSQAEILTARCQIGHIDPLQQTALAPGDVSHWLQPWRGFIETWPAKRMREAAVVSVSGEGSPALAAQVALFAEAGVHRAFAQVQWENVDPDKPTQLGYRRESKRNTLIAMRERRIRPMILVDAFAELPGRSTPLVVAVAASRGATQIRFDPGSVAQIKPGRTAMPTKLLANPILIKDVQADGMAILSRGLNEDLPAGRLDARTNLFSPFPRPFLPDGKPNPAFDEPMNGWLDLLKAVATEAVDVLRTNDFDLLIFNGDRSPVLDINRYHDPPLPDVAAVPLDQTLRVIMERTAKWVRDPINGISGAGLIDGFMNRRWTESGATTAPGVTAISRHLAVRRTKFSPEIPAEPDPGSAMKLANPRWLGTAGQPDAFIPRYAALFPEIYLTGLTTVPLLGRLSENTGSARPGSPPEIALTAFSLIPGAVAGDGSVLSKAEIRRVTSKSVLRSLSAYVGKGVGTLAFYESGMDTDLTPDDDPTGGETLQALKRFLAAFDSPAAISTPRPIALASVGDCSAGRQFDGDGTKSRPPLRNRDVVAFFPFQLSDHQFIISTYVMTRDIAKPYGQEGSPLRLDMPAQTFTLAIDRINGDTVEVTATDPLLGIPVPVKVRGRSAGRIWIELPLTDSPRLLKLSEP